jgi:hypothetical protein
LLALFLFHGYLGSMTLGLSPRGSAEGKMMVRAAFWMNSILDWNISMAMI